jgi:CHAT domain-containing protein
LVVLNACDSGEEQKVGSFIDGWASVLLETGASGFIGGLWPLGDKGAAEFSKEFYEDLNSALKAGRAVSVADLLRRVRGQFSITDDPTFLAYVFYGDARLQIVP